jgi:hypothetical protein
MGKTIYAFVELFIGETLILENDGKMVRSVFCMSACEPADI